jgi:HSP20 family protein
VSTLDFKQYGGESSASFEQFRNLTNMNEQLRRVVGPQFLQNLMKNMPMQELEQIQNMDWSKIFGAQFGGDGSAAATGPSASSLPRIDIYQTRQEVVAVVEVPGLESANDVKINVTADSLTVSGSLEGRFSTFEKDRFLLNERFRGSFERTVSLPVRVRPQQARAIYRNGLLEVRMIKVGRSGNQKRGRSVPVSFD